uniref:unspecific monooxygenase n=1 Tax=Pyxicephalus adspersus TaxID=30357 RepID=A0AAV3AC03_PYXAD|nr:TPA: hypothetical protein GDO54_017578 [Pyxicephalus adspersus]
MKGDLVKSLMKITKKYGPIYTIYFGSRPIVVVTGYQALKEVFLDYGDAFLNRGSIPVFDRLFNSEVGLPLSNGESWKQLRQFSLITLKDFGMGRKTLEEPMQEEAHHLVEYFRNTKGLPFNPILCFSQVSANVMCSVLFGKRYSYKDPDFQRLLHIVNNTFISMSSFWGQLFDIYDVIMRNVPGPHHKTCNCLLELEEFVREKTEICKATLNASNPRHVIDCFLIQMEKEKHIPSTYFNLKNLYATILSLFIAGTETVATTIRHGFLLLLKYPNAKRKVQEEIDQVIGKLRVPAQQDREYMPYTDAVVHEIHRFADVFPMNLPHKASRSTQFRGYTIPKDTTVYPVLSSVLRDPKQFKYPNQFNPGHFLDENGKFCRNDGYMPFSSGKRICLGEGLAKMELFLFFTTILQNFTLKSPKDPADLDLRPMMSGFGNVPGPYELCFIPR